MANSGPQGEWGSTIGNSCSNRFGDGCSGIPSSCTTGQHAFYNIPRETCLYSGANSTPDMGCGDNGNLTCSASVLTRGCYFYF